MHHSITRKLTVFILSFVVLTATSWILPSDSEARRVHNTTRHSVHKNTNRNVNRNTNVRRNTNVNVRRDVNVDVDVNYRRRYPVGAAVGAAAVTAAVVGSIVYSLPSSCRQTVINGIVYQQCGNSWYQPQYSGSQVTYIVVNPPN